MNRSKNKTVREDIPLAKYLQNEEEDEATQMRKAYDKMMQEQVEQDERIAKEIQQRLLEQENQQLVGQKIIEEEDKKLAKRLFEREKAKLMKKRLAREKLQVEKVRTQLLSNGQGSNGDLDEVNGLTNSIETVQINERRLNSSSDDDLDDLSDFLMPPPPGLTPEQVRLFQEEQDAEIARFLQEQELQSKRKSNVNKDKLAVIEAQDYEIARMLQKQEKERIRRLKEKIRQRQLRKQMQQRRQQEYNSVLNEEYNSHPHSTLNSNGRNGSVNYSDVDSITYEEPYQCSSQSSTNQVYHHHNIAIDLDPTYKRKTSPVSPAQTQTQTQVQQPQHTSPLKHSPPVFNQDDSSNGIHFAQVYQVTPSSSPSSTPSPSTTPKRITTANTSRDPDDETNLALSLPMTIRHQDVVSPIQVPQYMPVQGQRRMSSSQKKNKKKDFNQCKTQ